MIVGDPNDESGTGFITLTLAGHLPARVGLPRPAVMQRFFYPHEPPALPRPDLGQPPELSVAALGPQPDQVIAEHLLHPRIEVHDQP